MKAHTYYIIYGRPPIGRKLSSPPSGGATASLHPMYTGTGLLSGPIFRASIGVRFAVYPRGAGALSGALRRRPPTGQPLTRLPKVIR